MNHASQIIRDREFKEELLNLLEKHKRNEVSGTPAYVLARYIMASVEAFELSLGYRNAALEQTDVNTVKTTLHRGPDKPTPLAKTRATIMESTDNDQDN